MAVRLTRDAWAVGKAACGGVAKVRSRAVVGRALERAAGDRFRCEAWMVFV